MVQTWRGSSWRVPTVPAAVLAAAAAGVVSGVVVGTVPLAPGDEPWSATAAVLFGVAVGLVMGIAVAVDRGAVLEHAGSLRGRPAREAAAASAGGRMPEDPEVRAAALRMTSARLQRVVREGRCVLLAPVIITVSQFFLHGMTSWVPWVLLVMSVLGVVEALRAPRVLQRRVLELAPPIAPRRTSGVA